MCMCVCVREREREGFMWYVSLSLSLCVCVCGWKKKERGKRECGQRGGIGFVQLEVTLRSDFKLLREENSNRIIIHIESTRERKNERARGRERLKEMTFFR
jgi:hypothetical protein